MAFQTTTSAPRPLPVFILADTSGSMTDHGKLAGLNLAIGELIGSLAADDEVVFAEPHVGVVTFGGFAATEHLRLAPVRNVSWRDVTAGGMTPMGSAFELTRTLIEDRDVVPRRAYRPVLVLVSDGQPNDSWRAALDALIASPRAQKADRFALAIGPDADETMLRGFTGDAEMVLRADGAREIRRFFRYVTMSVIARSHSIKPNAALPPPALSFADMDD